MIWGKPLKLNLQPVAAEISGVAGNMRRVITIMHGYTLMVQSMIVQHMRHSIGVKYESISKKRECLA